MAIDTTRVARRFNRHAHSYDDHARVQADMVERVTRTVTEIQPPPHRILELGAGTGLLTERLAALFPAATLDAVDIAENMVAAAQDRLRGAAHARVSVADIETEDWGSSRFDLIVSSATIQWLSRLEETFARLAGALRPGGRMVHATFGPRTFEELFSVLAEIEGERGLTPVPHGLGPPPAEAWDELLRRLGLIAVEVRTSLVRPCYASCRACLRDLRGTGASYAPDARADVSILKEAMRRYDERFRVADGVVATYEVIELSALRR